MTVMLGNASIDENGKISGGKAGDQTGKEVCTRKWYLHKKGWRLLRHRDPVKADLIAMAMERACANDRIGYDQYQRDTLLAKAAPYKYDPGLVTSACECDCSALVRVCIAYAYGSDVVDKWRKGARFSTATMCGILLGSGDFLEMSEAVAKTDKYLLRGDILCTKTQGHTVVVLTDGPQAAPDQPADERGCPYKAPTVNISKSKNRKGDGVRWVQWMLNAVMDGEPKLIVDGIFGAKTDQAVRAFQQAADLKVDGIVGKLTRKALSDWLEMIQNPLDPDAVDVEEDDGISEGDGIAEPFDGHHVDGDGYLGMTPEERAEVEAELANGERGI